MSDEPLQRDRDRAIEIMRRVLTATARSKVHWKARSGRQYSFDADMPSGNIEIGTTDNDGVSPFDMRFYNVPSYELILVLEGREDPNVNDILRELYNLVARQVRGIDPTLDGLLADLSDEDVL